MRGYKQDQQEDMFSYISLEDSVPKNLPATPKVADEKASAATPASVRSWQKI